MGNTYLREFRIRVVTFSRSSDEDYEDREHNHEEEREEISIQLAHQPGLSMEIVNHTHHQLSTF